MPTSYDILGLIFGVLSLSGAFKHVYAFLKSRQPLARAAELAVALDQARSRAEKLKRQNPDDFVPEAFARHYPGAHSNGAYREAIDRCVCGSLSRKWFAPAEPEGRIVCPQAGARHARSTVQSDGAGICVEISRRSPDIRRPTRYRMRPLASDSCPDRGSLGYIRCHGSGTYTTVLISVTRL